MNAISVINVLAAVSTICIVEAYIGKADVAAIQSPTAVKRNRRDGFEYCRRELDSSMSARPEISLRIECGVPGRKSEEEVEEESTIRLGVKSMGWVGRKDAAIPMMWIG